MSDYEQHIFKVFLHHLKDMDVNVKIIDRVTEETGTQSWLAVYNTENIEMCSFSIEIFKRLGCNYTQFIDMIKTENKLRKQNVQ